MEFLKRRFFNPADVTIKTWAFIDAKGSVDGRTNLVELEWDGKMTGFI